MTVEPDTAGSSELAALLLSEAAAGIEAATPAMTGWIRVEQIVVRVGSRADSDEVDWQAEMSVVPDDDRNEPVPSPADDIPIPPALARLEVTAIDGVTDEWRARLAGESITTVGDVAALDLGRRQRLVAAHGREALAIAARARTCRVSVEQPGQAGTVTVGKLLDLPFAEVSRLVGNERDASAILAVASALASALRLEVLDSIRIDELAPPPPSSH